MTGLDGKGVDGHKQVADARSLVEKLKRLNMLLTRRAVSGIGLFKDNRI
jgi:hypothetical protein